MLSIEDLCVRIKNKEILKGVNLKVPEGEVHALFGPNGSGKSVMIMTLMGYPEYEISSGRILLNGRDISGMSIDERVRAGLSFSEQKPPTIKGVRLEQLLSLLQTESIEAKKSVSEMIKRFDVERFLARNINDGLSGGETKLTELFLSLISNPCFLILDEPDSGVDPEHLKKIGKLIDESFRGFNECGKKSGLIATHSASILDYVRTDRAHIMMDGRIKCSGNPQSMMEEIKYGGYSYCIENNGK